MQKRVQQQLIALATQCPAQVLLVMDADLQHPPESVPKLLAPLLNDNSHFSLGSRYIEGGGTKDWALHRQLIRCAVTFHASRMYIYM